MLDAGLLDDLMGRIDDGDLQLTGDGGFIPEMIKAVLERGLGAELTSHLGYRKGDPAGRAVPNSRNGTTPKTVHSEVGSIPLDIPRDRNSTFEPRLVPKGERQVGDCARPGRCAWRSGSPVHADSGRSTRPQHLWIESCRSNRRPSVAGVGESRSGTR